MKIERFPGNSPAATNATEGTQNAANGLRPSSTEPSAAAPPAADSQFAARAHAASQKGNLNLYGTTQRLKLSSQTTFKSSNLPADSQTSAQFRMQSLSTGASAPTSFASQRRNAVSYPSVTGSPVTMTPTPGGNQLVATPGSIDNAKVPTPAGNRPIATPDNSPAFDSKNKPIANSGSKNRSWSYRYEKSISLRKSGGDETTNTSKSPASSGADNEQGFTHAKRNSNIARGSGGLTAYGEGKTTSESSSSVKSWDKTFAEGKGYQVNGEAAALEARSRTFEYDSGLGVGAQAEASLIRGKVGVQATKSHMVGGAEVVGVSGHASVDGQVGARATAEAGVGVGRDGLPAVRVGAEAFVGARVDMRAGGEARLMGVGADATGTASTMTGAQASTEASLSPTGVQASASAFAGASVGTSGSASIAGVGASGSAEAWAGVGAKAELDAGYTDGKLQFQFGAGAALGVGGAVSSGFTWDINQTKTDAERLAHNTEQLVTYQAQKIAPALNEGVQQAGSLATNAAAQAETGFRSATTGVTQAVQTASQEAAKLSSNVEQTATAAANTVANAVNTSTGAAASAVSTGAQTVATAATSTAKTVAKTATAAAKTATTAAKAAQSAAKAASNAAKSVLKWF